MATLINSDKEYKETVINNDNISEIVEDNLGIRPGTLIFDEYEVKDKLEDGCNSGEAILLLCVKSNKEYVAKIYKRNVEYNTEIRTKINDIDSDYIVTPVCVGVFNEKYCEIMEYYTRGSLRGKKYSYEELKDIIIPQINKGLKCLHEHNIIHKDIKPSNILLKDDNLNIAITDFGISSCVELDVSHVRSVEGTFDYEAPEQRGGVALPISDYYSFGITIYELYYGVTPRGRLSKEEYLEFITLSNIPFTGDDMPQDLVNLIKALTYKDISNRKNKKNPNNRWGYDQVCNWINGIEQIIPGGMDASEDNNYLAKVEVFGDKRCVTVSQLVEALAENWELAKAQLMRGHIARILSDKGDHNAGNYCSLENLEKLLEKDSKDVVLFRCLYKISGGIDLHLYWKGNVWNSIQEFGNFMLKCLCGIETEQVSGFSEIDDILRENIVSKYMKINRYNDALKIEKYENLYKKYSTDNELSLEILYELAYILSEEKTCCVIQGKEFNSKDDLHVFLKQTMMEYSENNEMEKFEDLLDLIMGSKQFRAWWTVVLNEKRYW